VRFKPRAVLRSDDQGAHDAAVLHAVNPKSDVGAGSNIRRDRAGTKRLHLRLLTRHPSATCQKKCHDDREQSALHHNLLIADLDGHRGCLDDPPRLLKCCGRFRVNLHRERGRAAATIRALPAMPPRLSELGLPPQVEQITRLHHGLVLVGGATGSGKTTTVAALVNEINRRDAKHIITIEDPIEFEHAHQHSVIEQVEIGIDAPDFPTALRAALRQAPDVIVIGEMRDPETMKIALTAGETGHLVFSTLHTTDVTSTVARVADSFPPERQPTIRQDLSMALGAVLTQTLLARVGGGSTSLTTGGRIPACELLMVGYDARQHIRKNALQHLHQEITMTKKSGSVALEESLAQLVHKGLISAEDARARTGHADELEGLLRH
jgi:twitching motility protein PilT